MLYWHSNTGITMRGSRIFRRGGGGGGGDTGQSDKKALTTCFWGFFSLDLSLFYRSEYYYFLRFRRGAGHFPGGGGGVKLFPGGGGGSNCLLPVESHITCDFPGEV